MSPRYPVDLTNKFLKAKTLRGPKLFIAHAPRRRRPVEDYLRGQGRYRHLFKPQRNEAAIGKIQAQVDRYWKAI